METMESFSKFFSKSKDSRMFGTAYGKILSNESEKNKKSSHHAIISSCTFTVYTPQCKLHTSCYPRPEDEFGHKTWKATSHCKYVCLAVQFVHRVKILTTKRNLINFRRDSSSSGNRTMNFWMKWEGAINLILIGLYGTSSLNKTSQLAIFKPHFNQRVLAMKPHNCEFESFLGEVHRSCSMFQKCGQKGPS